MRIKNRYSIGDRVEIVVDTDHKFLEIARVVDSDKFIQEARKIRSRLGMEEPIVDMHDDFVDLFTHWEKIYRKWAKNNKDKEKKLDLWVRKILRILNLDKRYRNVLIQAVLFNVVVSYRGLIEIFNENSKFTHSTVAIIPTPHTTYDEIKEALRESKKMMKLMGASYRSKDKVDTMPSIRRYRDWFWKVALGQSYKEIAKEWNKKKNTNYTYSDIRRDLNKYQKTLL